MTKKTLSKRGLRAKKATLRRAAVGFGKPVKSVRLQEVLPPIPQEILSGQEPLASHYKKSGNYLTWEPYEESPPRAETPEEKLSRLSKGLEALASVEETQRRTERIDDIIFGRHAVHEPEVWRKTTQALAEQAMQAWKDMPESERGFKLPFLKQYGSKYINPKTGKPYQGDLLLSSYRQKHGSRF